MTLGTVTQAFSPFVVHLYGGTSERLFVEAVLYRYRAGIPWRDLPERFGDFRVVHTRSTPMGKAWNRTVFETWLESCLLPLVEAAQVVVMDNATFHKGGRIEQLIQDAGCKLLYLPPYSRLPQQN